MTTNGMTVIEKQFMETMIRNSGRIADALEEANKLKREELEAREKEREQTAALIEALKWLK
jgi:hypothetical protein